VSLPGNLHIGDISCHGQFVCKLKTFLFAMVYTSEVLLSTFIDLFICLRSFQISLMQYYYIQNALSNSFFPLPFVLSRHSIFLPSLFFSSFFLLCIFFTRRSRSGYGATRRLNDQCMTAILPYVKLL